MNTKRRTHTLFLLTIFLFSLIFSVPAHTVQAAPLNATYCGPLGEYTSWYGTKPVLWVWKNGGGKPNPTNVKVKFNGNSVSNSDSGVLVASPQVDNGNGWVGYFIAKRWYLINWQWDDDSRWNVSGCVEN